MADYPAPIYVCSTDAIQQMCAYVSEQRMRHFLLVSDFNTYPILGQMVEQALASQGASICVVTLAGDPVVADEKSIESILHAYDGRPQTFLAVGSGTITDLTRFTSFTTGNAFISLPTAPSVDGYCSGHAPIIRMGFKETLPAQPPAAIFAHLPTLCAAPREMIAAGFGDLLGKFTSLADWQLGALLWDEPYDEASARQTNQALAAGLDQIDAIAAAEPDGIRTLMDALIESGLSMLRAGNSRPASGAEHHIAHFWEMRWLRENKPTLLHGVKVGVGCCLSAGIYAQIGKLSADGARQRASRTVWPPANWVEELRSVYGPQADAAIASQKTFIEIDSGRRERLIADIGSHWPAIQSIAERVPAPQKLRAWLRRAGSPAEPREIGLTDDETRLALNYADGLRNRFTVLKLAQLLGVERRLYV
jgi:glycerol-1-phosphate dehydrogenase [NAD(P)+]